MNVKIDNRVNDQDQDTNVRKTLIRSKKNQAANSDILTEPPMDDSTSSQPFDPRIVRELDPDDFFKLGKFRI